MLQNGSETSFVFCLKVRGLVRTEVDGERPEHIGFGIGEVPPDFPEGTTRNRTPWFGLASGFQLYAMNLYIYIDAVCVFDPVYYNGICKIAWDSAVRGQIFLGRVLHSAFHVYVFFGCKCNYNQL